jgi:mono/diheme cytochrome c family protein
MRPQPERGLTSRLLVAIGFQFILVSTSHAQEPGDPVKGLAFANRHCAACHGILPNDQVSPRRGLSTFHVIANTPGMTGTAISVWLRNPHKEMPDFIIDVEDRTNVIAYILSLREPRSRP